MQALVNRQFTEAKVQCEKALRLDPPQEVEAQLYEWIAITERFLERKRFDSSKAFSEGLCPSKQRLRIQSNWDQHIHDQSTVAEPNV